MKNFKVITMLFLFMVSLAAFCNSPPVQDLNYNTEIVQFDQISATTVTIEVENYSFIATAFCINFDNAPGLEIAIQYISNEDLFYDSQRMPVWSVNVGYSYTSSYCLTNYSEWNNQYSTYDDSHYVSGYNFRC